MFSSLDHLHDGANRRAATLGDLPGLGVGVADGARPSGREVLRLVGDGERDATQLDSVAHGLGRRVDGAPDLGNVVGRDVEIVLGGKLMMVPMALVLS